MLRYLIIDYWLIPAEGDPNPRMNQFFSKLMKCLKCLCLVKRAIDFCFLLVILFFIIIRRENNLLFSREFLELDAELPRANQTSTLSSKNVLKMISKVHNAHTSTYLPTYRTRVPIYCTLKF